MIIDVREPQEFFLTKSPALGRKLDYNKNYEWLYRMYSKNVNYHNLYIVLYKLQNTEICLFALILPNLKWFWNDKQKIYSKTLQIAHFNNKPLHLSKPENWQNHSLLNLIEFK